ncbi:MAG: hypothetical protein ACTSW1_05810 [Candidatus Hodarchaeales archaeon]
MPTIKVNIKQGIPGSGKTRSVLIHCGPLTRITLSSYSHKLLEEFERKLDLAGIPYTRWQGISRICPLRNTNQTIKAHIENNTPPKYLCTYCQRNNLFNGECPYQQQFVNPETTLLCPSAYLFSNRIRDFNPDHIYLDDDKLQKRNLPTRAQIISWVSALHDFNILDRNITLTSIQNNPKYYANQISERISRVISEETSDPVFLKRLNAVSVSDLLDYLKLTRIYGRRDQFAVPLIFQIFEHAKQTEVTIIDAIPNRQFLDDMAQRYQRENPDYSIEYEYLDPLECDAEQNSEVYRVRLGTRKNAVYSKITLRDPRVRNRINAQIEKIIANRFQNKKIGIISMKELVSEFHPRAEKRAYYANLRGSNLLEDVDVLFVIGTYIPNIEAIQKDFELFYARTPTTLETVKVKGEGYVYSDSPLDNFSRMNGEYEMYQALHRCRPALSTKKIFVWGIIPKWIKEEFPVYDLVDLVDNEHGGYSVYCLGDMYQYIKRVLEESESNSIKAPELVNRILAEESFPYKTDTQVYKILRDVVDENDNIDSIPEEIVLRNRRGRGRPPRLIRLNNPGNDSD